MMLACTPCEEASAKKFSKKLKLYLDKDRCKAASISAELENSHAHKIGQLCLVPASDITHVFNNEAMLAMSHAIEDLASETREGELISTFQKFENFCYQKKRYLGLAKDLDSVRIWGCGEIPKRCPHIDFVPIHCRELLKYWVVLFSSPKCRALLVCKQVNQSEVFARKIFMGFYTFNPFLVESFRQKLNLMSCGLRSYISKVEKDIHLPEVDLKDIRRYFGN